MKTSEGFVYTRNCEGGVSKKGKKAEKKRKTMRQCKDRERREGKPMDAKLN